MKETKSWGNRGNRIAVSPVPCLSLVTAAAKNPQQHQKQVDKIQI